MFPFFPAMFSSVSKKRKPRRTDAHLVDAALALDVLDKLDVELATLGAGSVGSEGPAGLPLGRGAGSGLLQHLVDLLKSETLGLGDEEVGVDKGAGAETAPDEEDG